MGKKDAGELLAGREVVQYFHTVEDNLTFISPVFATYCRQNAGSLTISLHRTSGSPTSRQHAPLAECLAEATISCGELSDNEPFDLAVRASATSKGELLALCIRTREAQRGYAPTIWLSDKARRIPGHVTCLIGAEAQEPYGITAATLYGGSKATTTIPQMILYSPVTQCNLNCIHCISRHTRRSVNWLPDCIKNQLQAWCAAGQVEMVASDYSGDILWADSRTGAELDFLFGLGVPFHLDTNGVHLTADISARLCRNKISALNVSLDAATDKTYQRVRKGAPPLHKVTENIAGLLQARASACAKFEVSISFTLMRSTLAEWPDFIRLAASLGVDIVYARHLEAYTADMEEDSLWHDQTAYNAALLEVFELQDRLHVKVAAPPPFRGLARHGKKPCSVPWNSAVILGNGDIAACCVPGLIMGNLHEASMEEIWNGPRYEQLRATVNSSDPPPSCAACPVFRETDNKDSYLIYSAKQRLTNNPCSP